MATVSEVLAEAESIFHERGETYGSFETGFRAADRIFQTIDPDVFPPPVPGCRTLTAMIAVKLSRGLEKEDTILDLINYLAMLLVRRRNHATTYAQSNTPTEAGA